MKRVALISGATGFIGTKVFENLRRDCFFDETVLIGKARHMDALRRLADSVRRQRVSVINLSDLENEVGKQIGRVQFYVLILANSFIRDSKSINFADYLIERVLDTKCLIEPLLGFQPYVLYPLSWHSWRTWQTPYSASKNAVEQLLLGYEAQGEIVLGRVALFDTYGPDDKRDKLVPSLLRDENVDASKVLSDPGSTINLTHSDDIVRGLRIMVTSRTSGLYQLRHPSDIRVWEVAKYLGRWSSDPPEEPKGTGLPQIPAQFPPGWRAKVDLESGLSQLAANRIRPDP